MEKKELWLALSALGVAATSATSAAAATEQAGVASKVNPAVEAIDQISTKGSRVIFVGNDVFRGETIRTDAKGQTHLVFLDQSSLTVGPKSEIVIDHFVFDPKTNSGDLTMSATKGVLRIVGGALSKTGKINVKTPIGNLGIRGAVTLIEVLEDGTTTAYFLYGVELTGTVSASGLTRTVRQHEQSLTITPDGRIEIAPISVGRLKKILLVLQGPKNAPPPKGQNVPLPDNYKGWLRELANQNEDDRGREDEERHIGMGNRDIDDLAS
ncbi:MAG: FecR domain-containing protein [Thermodesulfobacteriota bacterium]